MDLRKYPNPNPDGSRMETGPVQFGDDWPGVFIRGDQACWAGRMLSLLIEHDLLKDEVDVISKMTIEGIADMLSSCHASNFREDAGDD